MKKLAGLILLGILLLSNAPAQAAEPLLLDGTDVSPVVEYFRPLVMTLKKPITVYNWSETAKLGDGADTLDKAKERATVFWKKYGDGGDGSSMFGSGLYAAIDPVITASYGGKDGQWRLLVLALPAGARVIDLPLQENSYLEPPAAARKILTAFDCQDFSPMAFFRLSGAELTESCRRLGRAVFADALKLDAFVYSYNKSELSDCRNAEGLEARALVILRGEWMTSENVTAYTATSTHHFDERAMIQTLFVKARGSEDSSPILTVNEWPNQPLLWPDLEGKRKPARAGAWIRKNLFACDGRLPYGH